MSKYVIRNLTPGRVVVPHPINLPINRESVIIVNAPAHLVEQFDYRFRKHPIAEMLRRKIISITSYLDTNTPESVQVPTVEIVRRLTGTANSYYFGQQVYTGANVPPGTVIPGNNFFDFTLTGLVFFNVNPKLQNCRVFLNGVLCINGDSFTHQDVRLGPSPSHGDLVFDNPSYTIRDGDVISVEANV